MNWLFFWITMLMLFGGMMILAGLMGLTKEEEEAAGPCLVVIAIGATLVSVAMGLRG